MNAGGLVAESTSSVDATRLGPLQVGLRVLAVLLAVLPLTLMIMAALWSAPRDVAAGEVGASDGPPRAEAPGEGGAPFPDRGGPAQQ